MDGPKIAPKMALKIDSKVFKAVSNELSKNVPTNCQQIVFWDPTMDPKIAKIFDTECRQIRTEVSKHEIQYATQYRIQNCPGWPQIAQDNPKLGVPEDQDPQMGRDCSKSVPMETQIGSRQPKLTQNGPKMAPMWPSMVEVVCHELF